MRPLPGEISAAQAAEKSAEAVVAMTPVETREQRRAEETNGRALWSIVMRGKLRLNVSRLRWRTHQFLCESARPGRCNRRKPFAEKTPVRTHEPGTDSKAGATDGSGRHPLEVGSRLARCRAQQGGQRPRWDEGQRTKSTPRHSWRSDQDTAAGRPIPARRCKATGNPQTKRRRPVSEHPQRARSFRAATAAGSAATDMRTAV